MKSGDVQFPLALLRETRIRVERGILPPRARTFVTMSLELCKPGFCHVSVRARARARLCKSNSSVLSGEKKEIRARTRAETRISIESIEEKRRSVDAVVAEIACSSCTSPVSVIRASLNTRAATLSGCPPCTNERIERASREIIALVISDDFPRARPRAYLSDLQFNVDQKRLSIVRSTKSPISVAYSFALTKAKLIVCIDTKHENRKAETRRILANTPAKV